MDSTADQWPQEVAPPRGGEDQRKVRPQKDKNLNCPRCHSTNTKFCYYNNYSLTQPRYFCKTCRRYWTAGGTLRNVPVGGGSRKNTKRPSSSSTSTSTSNTTHLHHHHNNIDLSQFSFQNPNYNSNIISTHESQDLNLAFSSQDYQGIQLNLNSSSNSPSKHRSSTTTTSLSAGAKELQKSASSTTTTGLVASPMAHDPNMMFTISSSGFPFQEFKPQVGFAVNEHLGTRYDEAAGNSIENNNDPESSTGAVRQVFPFGSLMMSKQIPSTNKDGYDDQNKNFLWNGMFGGAQW